MKNLIILISILVTNFAFGQPGDPCINIHKRIKELNEILQKDSNNHLYLWERARLSVECGLFLVNKDSIINDVTFLIDQSAIINSSTNDNLGRFFIEITKDFSHPEIYRLVDKYRNSDIDIREFYFLRGDLYNSMGKYKEAINDYSYAEEIDTTGIYKLRCNYAILNIYDKSKDYEKALQYADLIIDNYKRKGNINDSWYKSDYKYYFCQQTQANILKSKILKSLHRTDELISFHKTYAIDAFELYISESVYRRKYEDSGELGCLINYLDNGYSSIIELTNLFKETKNIDLENKYKKILKKLNEGEENWERVNKRISVEKLKSIISEIK